MNTIALQGILQSAPELRHTQDGLAQASAMLSFPSAKPDEADYTIRLVCFGNLAEEFHQAFQQGESVIVEGRLHAETRTKPDGSKERVVELIARRAHHLAAAATQPQPKAVKAQPAPTPPRQTAPPASSRGRTPAPKRPLAAVIEDDEIPF